VGEVNRMEVRRMSFKQALVAFPLMWLLGVGFGLGFGAQAADRPKGHTSSQVIVRYHTGAHGFPDVAFQGRPGILEAEDSMQIGNHGQPISVDHNIVVYKVKSP
jgi:hypothetical protein